jgi:pantoate--beta-alanine ligase
VSVSIFPSIAGLREAVAEARAESKLVGVVPTMGALHEGHLELIRRARAENDFVVVTIFVNPIQFNRKEDLDRYPRDLDADVKLCERARADVVFAPSVSEMYPAVHPNDVQTSIEVTGVSDELEGRFRPGHFKGVATVVAKLFNIVAADRAYFGEKDAQQLAVIQKMVRDLNFAVQIVPVPTVREPDGLAMSSRNRLLTPENRLVAPALYRALASARDVLKAGMSPNDAIEAGLATLKSTPQFRIEYLEVADAATMQSVDRIKAPVRILTAAWLGQVRLIDNVLVNFETTALS